ncbi:MULTISPECIES: XdhC family protein [Methylomonas]|uniref:XshC-Cox1-family protein n=1 Tax=Methylomonas koyamae TaxID=702114 RepID=A0A291IPN8_9GAMM|nr:MULTISPECIES: XdhC family protein [Methylomonas]ANE57271.1 XshC-Cox1-family protein [Methylomonas sp. DH-1]ATG92249.1 XshC-Cox1-family protein [Methylomonas koyamae]OAI25009.1 XshC-Cox1-family protein [Methylomonas koyamae]
MIPDILDLQLSLREQRQPYVLATVTEILGSSSAKPAAKALLDQNGKVLAGWVGGGCAQSMVARAGLDCLETGEPCVIDIDLNDEVFGAGMPCGGAMRVYVEPVLPKPRLWLMGHGRIVESLCEFGYRLGFDVIVDDPQAAGSRFPAAAKLITDDVRYQQLQPGPGDFVVIATHHKGDYDALSQALHSEACYVALISSRKRAKLVLDRLAAEGFSEAKLGTVRAPAGLDLAAKLPEEIALSIISEMVAVRRGGSGLPLSRPSAAA